ncbi:MAG: DUF937 domain-containing protein [Thermoanaerobaculia bacterium]
MSSILEALAGQLTPETIRQMSSQIGATPAQTATAVETAVPIFLGQLQRNAATPAGASSLLDALDRNHDGSILDDVAGFLSGGPSASDSRSLDHIFGGRKSTVESAVARRSGLDGAQVMKLLAMLAPLLLGLLGKHRSGAATGASGSSGGLFGGGSGGGLGDLLGGLVGGGHSGRGGGGGSILSDLLGGAMGKMQSQSPGLGDMLGGLLDADHDGSIMDDLLEKGLGSAKPKSSGASDDLLGGLLGSLLGGKG